MKNINLITDIKYHPRKHCYLCWGEITRGDFKFEFSVRWYGRGIHFYAEWSVIESCVGDYTRYDEGYRKLRYLTKREKDFLEKQMRSIQAKLIQKEPEYFLEEYFIKYDFSLRKHG